MLMSKKNRTKIYEYLFKEGVLVAKKDYQIKHSEIDVPNLHVIKALQSLVSRGFVTEQFCWRHYYWYLNNEGIQYLRDFLHLPPEIVPATLKRQTQTSRPDAARRPRGPEHGGRPQVSDDRANYRRGPLSDRKEAGAGPNPNFQFRGGFGRGGGAPQPEQE